MGSELPELSPAWFWRSFRAALIPRCTDLALSNSRMWTAAVTQAAQEVCYQLGNGILVCTETPHRLDVSARFPADGGLAVAFESELAPVGYQGRRHDKTWREEFLKLCGISAKLRVLSSYFMPRTGPDFPRFLRCQLDSMADAFHAADPGQWLLVFGSEDSRLDADQPWLPFCLEPNFELHFLQGVPPFRPRRIARGLDPME